MIFKKFFRPFLYLLGLYVAVCFLLRILLIFNPIVTGGFSLGSILKIFFLGSISNALVFIVIGVLFWLYLLFLSDGKYKKPFGYIIFGLLLLLLIYISFFDTIFNQYGGVVPTLAITFVGIKTFLFGLLLFLPKYRKKIRLVLYSTTIFIFVTAILLNGISEFFFWNEFGVRYNFIAVDYLIYTNEVIGNIMESYPVLPLFTGLGVASLGVTIFIVYKTKGYLNHLPSFFQKIKLVLLNILAVLLAFFLIPALAHLQNAQNIFTNELQADGLHKFYDAFLDNSLNYFKFYPTINQQAAFQTLQKQIPEIKGENTLRNITDSLPEEHKNVVLITVESLSEEFLSHYGNKNNLTPFLDSLADKSLFFTNLYANGNRTVRGLEALTLSLPPTPGESIIKRKDNKNKFNIGNIFKQRGYQVKFMYGGYSYFDNMKDFFEGNGYDIVDRSNFKPDEITFANVWGVCDEDMANKAIETMNAEAAGGKPFFNHWMTVSNHRPYTFPNGKIDIRGDVKSRDGGVKYTDYALHKFFLMAEKQPWFKNTIFIIVADHCASSAGRTALPMDKYRIPAIVYSPNFIQPQEITKLCSQIDIMPTVLGLMHFTYSTKFFGQNVLDSAYIPRAFIATYQDLGFIRDSTLTVLSPVKQIQQYRLVKEPMEGVQPQFQSMYKEILLSKPDEIRKNETISFYQTASWLLQNKGYQQ
ncbi:alkaline phosphatase family protein [Arachidicoccus soli]|uniref:Alkaline phosphatase family protein n=1 Tax=Arachidicoccus soli TaxID=2341117 RepID=A0A386HKU7_9BACT|nr:alkaline phosphatase family protein [Arachidicoccus soli]